MDQFIRTKVDFCFKKYLCFGEKRVNAKELLAIEMPIKTPCLWVQERLS